MKWIPKVITERPHASMLILLAVGAVAGAFAARAFVPTEPGVSLTTGQAPEPKPAGRNRIKLSPEAERDAGLAITLAATRPVGEAVRANGQFVLNEDRTWHVSSITEGKIMAVRASLGDYVREGQVLAYLHSHDVHATRGAYQAAMAELDGARAAAALAQRADARAKRLLALTAISQESADQAASDLAAALTSVRKAEADVEKERKHMTEVLDVPAERSQANNGVDPDLVPIKAPASGVVMRRFVSAGSVVTTGTETFTVADLSSLWLIAAVNEADLANVQPGMGARISVRAYADAVFTGRVLQLGEELDATTRTLKVRVGVPNRHGRLKPEMFASVELERAGGGEAIFVPESAAQELNGQPVVFVETGSREFEVRPVRIAAAANGQMRIEEGVRDGDRVVTAGAFVLKSELLKTSL